MKHYLRQHGSALIILIVSIVVMSALGIAMLSMRTASSYTQMTANTNNRAYYLAESGKRYADFSTADGSGATGKTYRLSNGDEFQLTINSTDFVISTSTFYKDTALESVRSISGQKKNGMPCWTFDNSLNRGEDSCGSNNGTLNVTGTGITPVTPGRIGDALQFFNGAGLAGWIDTPFKPANEIGNGKPFSISFWAKPQISADQMVLGVNDGISRFSVGIKGGKWYWAYGNKDNQTLIDAVLNQWQKVTLVYTVTSTDNKVDLYVNRCNQQSSYDYAASGGFAALPTVVKKLFIGGENNNGVLYLPFTGLIDEVRIYDRALINAEFTPTFDAVAYYPFSGDANDQSGNNLNGTPITPILTDDRFGCSNRAYLFNGTGDYIHVPDAPVSPLDLTTEGTLSAWIYINTFKDYAGIIHKGDKKDFTDEAYSLKFCKNGAADCPVTDGSKRMKFTIVNVGKTETDSLTVFAPVKWYHVAATWDASLLKLYVNGVLDNTAVNTIGAAGTNGGLNIGSQLNEDFDATVKNFPFDGMIDDVLIFNRALSDVEIAALAADKP